MESTVNHRITEIWHFIQKGEHRTAKHRVVGLLREQPNLVPAWLLLAELLATREEKAKCYQRVLELDANNTQAIEFFQLIDGENDNKVVHLSALPELFDDFLPEYHSSDDKSDVDKDLEGNLGDDDDYEVEADYVNTVTDDVLATYVITELGSHVDEDDIIRAVSLRGQMDWYQAEGFVNKIKEKHALCIAKRRSPLRLIIAVPTLIAGIVWFVFTVIYVFANLNNSNTFNLVSVLLQSLRHFLGSLTMILGGSVGLYRVLKSLGKIT